MAGKIIPNIPTSISSIRLPDHLERLTDTPSPGCGIRDRLGELTRYPGITVTSAPLFTLGYIMNSDLEAYMRVGMAGT